MIRMNNMANHRNNFQKNKQNANFSAVQNKSEDVFGLVSKKKRNFKYYICVQSYFFNFYQREILQEDEFEEPEGIEQGVATKFFYNQLIRCEMTSSCMIIICHICATIDVIIL